MGVIYKLELKIKDFILEQKKSDPHLSCRKLSDLVLEKFQVNVSKSSVNYVVKEAGLSNPVGRKQKNRKGGLNQEVKFGIETNLGLPSKTLFLEKLPEAPLEPAIQTDEANVTEKQIDYPVEERPEEPMVAQSEETIEPLEESVGPSEELVGPIDKPSDIPVEIPAETPVVPQEQPLEQPLEQPEIAATDEPSLTPEATLIETVPENVQSPVEEIQGPVEKPVETPPVDVQVEEPSEVPCSGAILLKAADYLTGGIYYITEAIRNRLNLKGSDVYAKTESLLYGSLKQEEALWGLVNRKLSPEGISSHLVNLQSVGALSSDIFRVVTSVFQEVRYIKVTLTDNTSFYLDSQLYSVWSSPSIPYDFSSTMYNMKDFVNKNFQTDSPIALFMAPGYDYATPEFFNFVFSHDQRGAEISSLTLCGNKFEELEGIYLERGKKRPFVFGLWPWQFVEYRRVNKIGEFKPFHFATANKDYYIAEVEIELFQPTTSQDVTLRGCVLKTSLAEKARLIILSNLADDENNAETVANIYLSRWPNLEEAYKDYSRKIELFTYTADSQQFFSVENLNLLIKQETMSDVTVLLDYYLKALDLYVKWHFLPVDYENKDFSTINQCFYGLKAVAKRGKDSILVTFELPSGYLYAKDLEYTCRRINERNVCFADGRRLWLVV